jgi:hypothetical protein
MAALLSSRLPRFARNDDLAVIASAARRTMDYHGLRPRNDDLAVIAIAALRSQ